MKNKILRILYNFVCKLYSYFIFNFEYFFLRNSKKNINDQNDLLTKGFCVERLNGLKAFDFINNKTEVVNKYMLKLILSEKNIENLIYKIFIKHNLKELISIKTGYNYSIDYLIAYKTLKIQYEEINMGWYANHWHNDKPFSPNTLKVIVPIKPISSLNHGGLEIIDIKKSKEYGIKNKESQPDYQMIANCDEALIFFPNLCLHRAGSISENNYTREQLMFQLNPSKHWKINNNLLKKQYKIEPKFPLFSYFFDQYKYLI